MPYVGSYIWKMRQKVGKELMLLPAAGVVIEKDGRFLLVFNKDFQGWVFPGGYAEVGQSFEETAVREAEEEAGIVAKKSDLELIGTISGNGFKTEYPNGDRTQPFSVLFCCSVFEESEDELDTAEIEERKWFTEGEVDCLAMSPVDSAVWEVFKKWRETGGAQSIELE
jgi:8-oxo-dGTP pyrophosphatase MutT (NUDIX family)